MIMNIFLTTIIQCKIKNISNSPNDDDKWKQNKHKLKKIIYKLMFSHDRVLNVCDFILCYVFFCCTFGCLFLYNIFTHVIS